MITFRFNFILPSSSLYHLNYLSPISFLQMQEQLSDLQKKLAKEEEERTSVAKLNKELDKVQNLYSHYLYLLHSFNLLIHSNLRLNLYAFPNSCQTCRNNL